MLDANRMILFASIYQAAAMLVLGYVRSPWILIPVLIGSGSCWTATMSTINTSVQLSVPPWITARALGTYLMTFQGAMALGSVLWGTIAERSTTPIAFTMAAAGILFTLPFVHRFKILTSAPPDFTPYQYKRPAPELVGIDLEHAPDPHEGPVRISIEYRIALEHYPVFTHAIHDLRAVRLRDGAIRWGIFREAADPTHLNETFVMESWLDYLRSRERMTAEDARIRDRVYALHHQPDDTGAPQPPGVTHQIYAREVT